MTFSFLSSRTARRAARAAATGLALSALALPLRAQTDYYNTDAGRPVSVEDAYPVERHAFELQLAPVRLERERGGVYNWEIEPELAYGIFPRTQIEIGFPIRLPDRSAAGDARGLAGLDLSILHNLNVETTTLPALALAVESVLPVGSQAPDDAYASLKAVLTRTYRFARFHVNGRWTWGPSPTAEGEADELSRWQSGVAVDRTFPLRSALLIAAATVERPLDPDADLRWRAEGGVRYQWSPKLALDAGIAKRLTGTDRSWSVTFGAAYAFAIRSLMPR